MTIIRRIVKLLENKNNIVIAIDGQSGSGKSTLGQKLADYFNGLLIHMDDYFLAPAMKTNARLSQSGGNVHHERLKEELFKNLSNATFNLRKFNCMTNILEDSIVCSNNKVIIVEGVYSFHRNLRDFYDLKILLTIPTDVQLNRIKERSGEFMLNRFIKEWIPLENHYFKEENIEKIADIILEN